MSYAGFRNSHLVLPQQLIDFAWSAPMRDLASRAGMSDVGLRKLLSGFGISPPPQGYWNKLRAGKPVPPKPKPGARGPGQTGRLVLDDRFKELLDPVDPIPSSGPFVSALVPEDLDALRTKEVKAIGRAASARKLDPLHPALRQTMAAEERRREKAAKAGWHWDEPKFESPVDKRRLRILNALFLTLQKRGHSGCCDERDGELHTSARIGDTYVGLTLGIRGRHPTIRLRGCMRPDPQLPASTPLTLSVRNWYDREAGETWQDDAGGRLEEKLADIAAGVIVAGEAAFRRGLREEEERRERLIRDQEERRRQRVEALNQKRIEHLYESGALLRRANEIRAVIAELRRALGATSTGVDAASLRTWEEWALAEADKLDPIKSGQFRSHLTEPELEL